MISILFNPDCPELIFAAAALELRFEQEYPDEIVDMIPMYPTDFRKELSEICDALTADIGKYEKDFFAESLRHGMSEMMVDIYPDKIALLGIYPSNKQETEDLIYFFERESDRILFWIDNHFWPPGLLEYFRSQNKNIIVKEKERPLNLTGIYFPPEMVATEQAMMSRWRGNRAAKRYWRAYRQTKMSYGDLEKVGIFSFFWLAVDEIIFFEESLLLTILSEEYLQTMSRTFEVIKRFSADHPLFAEAKKHNRPIGFVSVRGLELVDMDKVIKAGLKKFPWLIVIENGTDEEPFLKLESAKMPIDDILINYTDVLMGKINSEKIMSAASKVVVGYRENIAV